MDIQKQFDLISSPEICAVLSQGLAQLYQNQPAFPVTYLAKWLSTYSTSQKRKKQLIQNKKSKDQRYNQIQQIKMKIKKAETQQKQQHQKLIETKNKQFEEKILSTKHLQDLLTQWLPQYIEKAHQLTGAYVGKLDFNKKPIEQGNFQLGAQNDTQNPKTITYIGASNSHKALMLGKTLPNGKGISYNVFQQKSEENNQQGGDQANNTTNKKSYINIENVLKEQNLHYFKYPKLGAYACFPIKIKSCLIIPSLDKAIVDYKTYLKTKEEAEKQYNQKVGEIRAELEEAQKKVEDFQLNEEDPTSQQQKRGLQNEAKIIEQKLQQLLKSPPIIQQVQFDKIQRQFFLAIDTLGQDKSLSEQTLQDINEKVQFFINQWQQKEKKMLLTDILTFLEEQSLLENVQNLLQEHEKNVISTNEPLIKEQFANKQKEAEFQLSLIKCQKTRQFLAQPNLKASMEVYLNYNVPKYTELIQIWCMLLQIQKAQINVSRSNQLDHRKIINAQSFKSLFEKLQKYQLRRQSSQQVSSEYRINKLLQRLQKIDPQGLSKYNGFLYVLHYLLKTYCWARILCRDAKKELTETKIRQKQERDNQIQKWLAEIQKNLQASKAELDQQGQQNFNQEEWRKNYQSENPRPEPLQQPVPHQFLDIE